MNEDLEPLDYELANLKKLNSVIGNVISALDASTGNAENVNETVQSADKLLDLWIRVLARSDQAQKLILDENWQGATSDMQAVEQEQSQASRRAREQQQTLARKEQEEREERERREQEDKGRLASSSSTTSRGRGSTRGRVVSGTGRGMVKKEVVSAYAQTARPKQAAATNRPAPSDSQASGPSRSSQGSSGTNSTTRGRGVPIAVRGTKASRGRQQGIGRSASGEPAAFK